MSVTTTTCNTCHGRETVTIMVHEMGRSEGLDYPTGRIAPRNFACERCDGDIVRDWCPYCLDSGIVAPFANRYLRHVTQGQYCGCTLGRDRAQLENAACRHCDDTGMAPAISPHGDYIGDEPCTCDRGQEVYAEMVAEAARVDAAEIDAMHDHADALAAHPEPYGMTVAVGEKPF